MKTPRGFAFAGISAGIKSVRKDMALVFSEAPCTAAGCFTVNKAKAAPVRDAEARLPSREVRAIVVNSGNANALTGPDGEADVLAVHRAAAKALGIDAAQVVSASTGVIGVRLPMPKMIAGCEALAAARSGAIEAAAEAILTTDTRVKLAHRTLAVGGVEVTIAAFCKGSGMIAPEMATMLAFLATDAAVTPDALQNGLRRAVRSSFNNLTVDDDMSTNDAVFALANGLSRAPTLDEAHPDWPAFEAALTSLCTDLARAIAEDGEGATKLVEVVVRGAPDGDSARDLAWRVAAATRTATARARRAAGVSIISTASSRDRRGRRGGHEARRGGRARRPRRRLGARSRARGGRVEPGQGGHLRGRSQLGTRPRRHRGARRRAWLRGRSAPRDGHSPGGHRLHRRGPDVGRSDRPPREDAPAADRHRRDPPGRERRGHRLGVRPLVRLREDQRRLHVAHRRLRGGDGLARRSAHELHAGVQAGAPRRGALVHRALQRYPRGHQVRRRGDGERLAQGELRQRREPPEERRPRPHRGARRRPRDHADASRSSAASGASSSRGCG